MSRKAVESRLDLEGMADMAKRTSEGLSTCNIIRYLKRFIAREIYGRVMADLRVRVPLPVAT